MLSFISWRKQAKEKKKHVVKMMRGRKCDCGREKAAEVDNRNTNRMMMGEDEQGEKGERCQRNTPTAG